MPIEVHLLKPDSDTSPANRYRGAQFTDREVRVRVVVDNAANLANVGVSAGTGQTVASTVFSKTLTQEGQTPFWSGWVKLDFAAYFVKVVAFEPVNNQIREDTDQSEQALVDDGS